MNIIMVSLMNSFSHSSVLRHNDIQYVLILHDAKEFQGNANVILIIYN